MNIEKEIINYKNSELPIDYKIYILDTIINNNKEILQFYTVLTSIIALVCNQFGDLSNCVLFVMLLICFMVYLKKYMQNSFIEGVINKVKKDERLK